MFTETYNTALGHLSLKAIRKAHADENKVVFPINWVMARVPAAFLPFIQQALMDKDVPRNINGPHVEVEFQEVPFPEGVRPASITTMFVVEKSPATPWVLSIENNIFPDGVKVAVVKKNRGLVEIGLDIHMYHAEHIKVTTYSQFVDEQIAGVIEVDHVVEFKGSEANPAALLAMLQNYSE